MMLQGFVHTSS